MPVGPAPLGELLSGLPGVSPGRFRKLLPFSERESPRKDERS